MFYFWVKIIKNFQRPTRGKFFIGFLWFITINSLIFIDIDDKLKCDKNETNSGVCAGMCRSMQVCVAVHGYMQVWVGVRGLEILFFPKLKKKLTAPPKLMTNDVYLTPIEENLH